MKHFAGKNNRAHGVPMELCRSTLMMRINGSSRHLCFLDRSNASRCFTREPSVQFLYPERGKLRRNGLSGSVKLLASWPDLILALVVGVIFGGILLRYF